MRASTAPPPRPPPGNPPINEIQAPGKRAVKGEGEGKRREEGREGGERKKNPEELSHHLRARGPLPAQLTRACSHRFLPPLPLLPGGDLRPLPTGRPALLSRAQPPPQGLQRSGLEAYPRAPCTSTRYTRRLPLPTAYVAFSPHGSRSCQPASELGRPAPSAAIDRYGRRCSVRYTRCHSARSPVIIAHFGVLEACNLDPN